jgi:rhomboid protease GluP
VAEAACWNCGRRNPGLWGFAPALRRLGNDLGFVPVVTWGCIALYVATLAADPRGIRTTGIFSFLAPSLSSLLRFGASGAIPVFGLGHWWTLASAGWLHGGLLHIAFNVLWLRQLAPATAEIYGASRMVILYTLAGIAGFLLSTLAGVFFGASPLFFMRGAQFTIGASAPIFGLLGALVAYSRRGSSAVGSQALGYAGVLFVFGLAAPGVDNYAHLGGFAGGFLGARAFDPFAAERPSHFLGALACLGLTLLAILASLLAGTVEFR